MPKKIKKKEEKKPAEKHKKISQEEFENKIVELGKRV